MIYKKITKEEFKQEFENLNWDLIGCNQFSKKGLEALYDFFNKTGGNIELDVISICCNYSEYSDLEQFAEEYADYMSANRNATNYIASNTDDENITSIEDIENLTTVIKIDNKSFMIENF